MLVTRVMTPTRPFTTARIYAGGKSEEMTGRIISKAPAKYAGLSVATKAHPSQPGGLGEVGIRGQLKASLEVSSRCFLTNPFLPARIHRYRFSWGSWDTK